MPGTLHRHVPIPAKLSVASLDWTDSLVSGSFLDQSFSFQFPPAMSRETSQNGDLDFEQMMGELAAMKSDLANRVTRAVRGAIRVV